MSPAIGSGSTPRKPRTSSSTDGPSKSRDAALALPNGGTVERHADLVTVAWPGGTRLSVNCWGPMLDVSLAPSAADGPALRGLFGSADGDPANDLTGRDGRVLDRADSAFFDLLHHQFGESWRIEPADSLFEYAPGESTETFTDRTIPEFEATTERLAPDQREAAEALCAALGVRTDPALGNCVLDVGTTSDPTFGAAAAAVAAATSGEATTGATGRTGDAQIGRETAGQITSPDGHDRWAFDADAGDIVYLGAGRPCTSDLVWRLVAPNGIDIGITDGCSDVGRRVLAEPGRYTIDVSGEGTGVGPYAFHLLAVAPPTTTPIELGQTVNDGIDEIGEWHEYTFSAAAGQVVYLQSHTEADESAPVASLRSGRLHGSGAHDRRHRPARPSRRRVVLDRSVQRRARDGLVQPHPPPSPAAHDDADRVRRAHRGDRCRDRGVARIHVSWRQRVRRCTWSH